MPPKTRSRKNQVASATVNNLNMPQLSPQGNRSHSQITSNSQTPMINIQNFDGNPDQLEFFINQIKQISKVMRWDDSYTVTFIKSKLAGNALTYLNQIEEIKPCEDPEELFEKIRNFFQKKSFATNLISWENLKMLPGESINNLTHRIDLAYHRLNHEITDEFAINQAKLHKFIKIIPSEIRIKILQDNIKNYLEATQKAKLIQDCTFNNEAFQDEQPEQINSLINKAANPEEPKLKSIEQSPPQKKPNYHFSSPKGRFNNRKFHQYKTRNQNNTYRRNVSRNTPQWKHGKEKCQLCFNFGHSAKFCRNTRQQNSNKNHPN